MHSGRHIFAALLASLAFAALAHGSAAQIKGGPPMPNPNAGEWQGDYDSKVIGHYTGVDVVKITGQGNAQVVHIACKVKDPSGNVVNFNVQAKIVDGHFSDNAGQVGGVKVTVEGRIDAPAAGERWPMRLTCNYRHDNGQSGRIVGIKKP